MIRENITKDYIAFRGMLKRIPGSLNFVTSFLFLSHFAVRLLQNNGKNNY